MYLVKAPSIQNVRYLYVPSLHLVHVERERVSGVLADITKRPIAIKTKGSQGL